MNTRGLADGLTGSAAWLNNREVKFQYLIKWGKSEGSGPRLNIKTVLSTYGDFHVKDKTAVRTSYL